MTTVAPGPRKPVRALLDRRGDTYLLASDVFAFLTALAEQACDVGLALGEPMPGSEPYTQVVAHLATADGLREAAYDLASAVMEWRESLPN
jgi:hypothetical protein